MLDLALLSLVALLTSAMTAVVGFGGGVVMIVIMLMFMPPAVAIPVHGLVQVVSNVSRVYLFRKGLSPPHIWRYSLLLVPGAALGMAVFQGLSEHTIKILIGTFALAFVAFRNSPTFGQMRFPMWSFIPLGFVVGVFSVTVGAVGVLFSTFLMRQNLRKEAINGNNAAFSLVGHIVKVVAFGVVGFNFLDHLHLLGVMWASVVVGNFLGRRLHDRISEETFVTLFNATMVVLALRLILWEGIYAWMAG